MNKIYKWCVIACAATTLTTSCNDFLEEDNRSGLTEDTFYKTTSGAEALVNSCYTPLRFWYGQEYAISMTEIGTDIFTRGNGCGQPELSDYNSSLQGSSEAHLLAVLLSARRTSSSRNFPFSGRLLHQLQPQPLGNVPARHARVLTLHSFLVLDRKESCGYRSRMVISTLKPM